MFEMQQLTKSANSFNRSDLKSGDILLLAIKQYDNPIEEFADFLGSALNALQAWRDGKSPEEIMVVAAKMIQISIAVFDGDRFSHVAIVACPEQGGSDASVVIEVGPGGMAVTELEKYLSVHPNPVAAVRYCDRAEQLDGKELPFRPVAQIANDLLTGEHINYGFSNTFVLAVMCAWRKSRGFVLEEITEKLIQYFGKSQRAAIELFFTLCGDDLRSLLVELSHVAGGYLRNRKELVCSEMVATCFNDATNPETGRRYAISLNRRPDMARAASNAPHPIEAESHFEITNSLSRLAEEIKAVNYVADLREPGLFFTANTDGGDQPAWWGNDLYTPADLSRSINTFSLGDWSRK